MKTVAPGVQRLGQLPLPIVNVYLADDILFDAATTWDRRRIGKQIREVPLDMVALTTSTRTIRGSRVTSASAAGSRSPATPMTSTRWKAAGRFRRSSR